MVNDLQALYYVQFIFCCTFMRCDSGYRWEYTNSGTEIESKTISLSESLHQTSLKCYHPLLTSKKRCWFFFCQFSNIFCTFRGSPHTFPATALRKTLIWSMIGWSQSALKHTFVGHSKHLKRVVVSYFHNYLFKYT